MNRILITNDDGLNSAGLDILARRLSLIGEVYAVAPIIEMSACSHSISLNRPVYVRTHDESNGYHRFGIDGTPADCVKLAVKKLLSFLPSLVVSGINRGPNTGINILYSGTVSGAFEGTILGIPSMAVSIASYENPLYETAGEIALRLSSEILKNGLPSNVCLNVNVPNIPIDSIKGMRITRQAYTEFDDYFDNNGDGGYILKGDSINKDSNNDNDHIAIELGYVSITPLHTDLTNYNAISELERLFINFNNIDR
ncbi:MAG: 5'/3'-nucleotidase SurE [bacterium]